MKCGLRIAGSLVVLATVVAGTRVDLAWGQSLTLSHPALVFTGRAGGADPQPQRLTVRTTPTPSATWSITTTPAPWLSILPGTGTGPGDVTLTVRIARLAAGIYHAQLTLASGAESKTVEVFLVITDGSGAVPPPQATIPLLPVPPVPPPGTPPLPPEVIRGAGSVPLARYLVEFTFIGYSGLLDGYPNCAVNPAGIDHMIGVLAGREVSEEGEDVVYRGSMSRFTMIDHCDMKPKAGRPDDVDWCDVTMTGGSTMRVEFTAYGEEGRGGYLKAEQQGTKHWKRVGGTCDDAVTSQVHRDYPGSDHGGGGSPNGQPIVDAGTVRLYSGGLARLRVGTYPARPPESVWSMRVLARIVP